MSMVSKQPPYNPGGPVPVFLGQLLAALYREGLNHARISRESIEDDIHTLVELEQMQDFDSTDWLYRWRIRGEQMPDRTPKPKPPLRDVHRDMAAAMFNKEPDAVTPQERKLAKNARFGQNYGADPYKVALDMMAREGTWSHRTILGVNTFVVVKQWKVRLLMALTCLWVGVTLGQLVAALITRSN